jgi:uroporphyrin-3 C-methyltransferase
MKKTIDDSNDSAEPAAPEDTVSRDTVPERADAAFDSREETVEEPAFDARKDDVVAARPPRRGFSSLVAWFALLVALLALATSAYMAWQNRASNLDAAGDVAATEARIAEHSRELDEAIDLLQTEQQGTESRLAEAEQQYLERIESVERELDELADRNESIAPRLGNLENALASLQGVAAGVRDTWMLAEAEYYMQVANAQLQLAGDPRIAELALNFADERIRQMADPALGGVRRALTEELQALKSMETFDLEGTTHALSSLAERVEALPLNETVEAPRQDAVPVDPELSGFARAVASMKRAFGDIVSVRRTDEQVTPMLSPDAAYFLRANLALQFQAARLALLKGQHGVFEQSLNDAAGWLREYYDTDSRAVASALETIAELADSAVDVAPPDISGSLRLLHQYRTLRDAESPDGSANGSSAEEPNP